MDNISKLGYSVKWLFGGTIVSNIINMLVAIFLIRKLPVDKFGIYSMFTASAVMFAVISVNGIIVTLRRFIPELIQKGYIRHLRTIVIVLQLLSFLVCTALIVIVFMNKKEVGHLLNISQFGKYYTIFIVNILLFLQTELCSAILISMYQQKIVTILQMLGVFLRGILYLILFSKVTVELIFAIEAVSLGMKSFPQFWFIFRKISLLQNDSVKPVNEKERTKVNRRITRYTFLSTVDEVGYGILSGISDLYFISAYLGPIAMGLYAFPQKLKSMVFNWIPLVQVNNVIKPFFISKYYAGGEDMVYLEKMFNLILKISILIYGVIAANLIVYQGMLHVFIFKSKYIQTQWLLIIMMFFTVLQCIEFPLGIILEIREKIEFNLYSKVFAVFNIVIVLIILRYSGFGLIGVATATGLSVFLKDYFIYFCMRRMTGISIDKRGLLRTCLVILSFFVVMNLLRNIGDTAYGLVIPLVAAPWLLIVLLRLLRPFNLFEEKLIGYVIDRISGKRNLVSRLYGLICPYQK